MTLIQSEPKKIYIYVDEVTTAWIYHNQTLWLISFSSDWTNWTTIADKNLWATTVYNDWDTQEQSNCGNIYQRWNWYGFPYWTNQSTSAYINASWYWPWNYYTDSTFRSSSYSWYYIWDSSFNNNLRWETTNTDAARQWPCENWFHIPSDNNLITLTTTLNSLWITPNINNWKTYLKMPLWWVLNQYWEFVANSTNLTIWSSDHWDNYNWLYMVLTGNWFSRSNRNKAYWLHIRPFKNNAVIPSSSRTVLYQPS